MRKKRRKLDEIFSLIKENWKDRYWWEDVIRDKIVSKYFRYIKGNKGVYIMDEDWDNLIILDACRYDVFVEVYGKKVDYRISRGSHTVEFLKENFSNRKFMDTIYITANPQVNLHASNSFYKIIPVWKYEWNEEINTVLPQSVFRYAIKAENNYPHKRLIIHFMQPHQPFLEHPKLSRYGFKDARMLAEGKKANFIPVNPWLEARKGKIRFDIVWKAYKRNLEIVLPYALKLAKTLKGKTVITSDHGEAFTRLKFPLPVFVAEHQPYIYIEELIKVPWLEIYNGKRKTIHSSEGEKEKERIREKIKKLKTEKKI